MQRETVYKANEILIRIDREKKSIDVLRNLVSDKITLYDRKMFGNILTEDNCPKKIFFDRLEIANIMRSKEKRIEMLEKELEEL